MLKFSMPFVLLAVAACAPVTPVESNAADAPAAESSETGGGNADASASAGGVEGGQPPSEPAPGVSEGHAGSGEVQPVPPEQIRVGPGIEDGSCKAEAAQGLVGRAVNDALVQDAVRMAGAKAVRVIPHDGMVTMDYRGDRLNIKLDEQGRIVAITCG